MKKSFLLIPIATAVLSACTTSKPAPVESVDGSLSPGIMQPVDNTGAAGSTWEPQVQQGTMPVGMDAPVVRNLCNKPHKRQLNTLLHKFHRILKFRATRKLMHRITVKSTKDFTKVAVILCVKATQCS